jgi:nucleoside-diphosphate-sugar epimerase
VRVLVRNFARAPRIARFELKMIAGDAADPDVVDDAVSGCEVVFHCAYDWHSAQRNLAAAQAVAEACLRFGIRRLVHVSTMSVYEPLTDGDVDETTRAEPCGWDYADTKLALERELLRFCRERALPVTILQPTIVYGPFSVPWTLAPVRSLRTGRVVLPDNGGLCNAVYVDDVVDALLLAADAEGAIGERLLISGPEPMTWHAFYSAYERMLGVESVVLMPQGEIAGLAPADSRGPSLRLLSRDPRRLNEWLPVRKFKGQVRRALGDRLWQRAKSTLPHPLILPDDQQLHLYRAHARIRIDKARQVLGYSPRYDFERGMELTGRFVAWANL